MARFDERFLEDLLARADLAELVASYATLEKKGNRLWARCPFHNEKTPSFTVSPDKQMYYCFGCGKGGGIINFIMEAERLDFAEAVEFLARQYHVELPTKEDASLLRARERLYEANREAARFFYQCLQNPKYTAPWEYIQKRGLSPEAIKRFGIGYAPDSWNSLTDHLRSKGFTPSEMVQVKLAGEKNKRVYDFFRHRLMFPILDDRGRVIAFGGRTLDPNVKGQKYLNTGNTPVFQKKFHLYAYPQARKSPGERMVLVEGYMDAVSLHQAGIRYAVASLGTALTPEQARLLVKAGKKEVIIAFDADRAGVAATERAMEFLAECGLSVRVLRIPGAKDPDEYVREHGLAGFERLIEQAADSVSYSLQVVKEGKNLLNEEEKVAYLKAAAQRLCRIKSPTEREIYAGRVARETDVSLEAVLAEVKQLQKRRVAAQRRKQQNIDTNPERLMQPPREMGVRYADPALARAEESLISLLSAFPHLGTGLKSQNLAERFTSKELARIYSTLLEKIENNSGIDQSLLVAAMATSLLPEDMQLYSRILAKALPHQRPEQELADLIEHIGKEVSEAEGIDPLLLLKEKKRKSGHGG
ncbi:MAG TPA: DNA primase [Clostridiales bacterium]|nr:DNA primase [Clostridiales bacterium]